MPAVSSVWPGLEELKLTQSLSLRRNVMRKDHIVARSVLSIKFGRHYRQKC